jgi:hypothetical protein
MFESIVNIVKRIWSIEVYRFSKKGWKNTLIGVCLLVLYFWGVPNFAKSIWP